MKHGKYIAGIILCLVALKCFGGINNGGGGSSGGITTETVTNITSTGATVTITGQGSHIINLESSGSAVGAAALTNSFNLFTSSNQFNGLFRLNSPTMPAYCFALMKNYDAGHSYLGIDSGSSGQNAGIIVGNLSGTDNISIDNDSSGNIRFNGGGANTIWQFNSGNFNLNSLGTLVIGNSSSTAVTMTGASMAIPNGLNIGSGILNLPILSTTIITNSGAGLYTSGSLTALNTVTASNLVATTTDGTSYLNSGTNQTMRIIVNGSAGTLKTEAMFTITTNTPSVALPVINTIYTNNASRLNLNASMGVVAGSGAYLWTVSGSQTNNYSAFIATATATNSISGYIQPNAFYMISNFSGTSPTLIPGQWNETRF